MVSPTLSIIVDAKDQATPTLKSLESSIIRFVGAVSAALATVQAITFPISAAANLQTELLNVGKTTEFTAAQLNELSKGLIEVSQRMNVTTVDLAKIAAAGGQMGLGKEGVDGLLQFTETAARFASVLDVTAEEAGNSIAKLSNIFGVAARDAEKIGSLLNEISNNSTANGADLVDMAQRIGTAGGTIGIKAAAALAATGRDLGLTVETVGTSFNKVFLDLQTKADDIAGAMGIPMEAWSAKVRTDGVGALKEYLSFLSRMAPAQRAAFAEQTTGGGRIFALITSLVNDASNGFVLLDRHLQEAEKGFEGGTSAIKEQERVLGGLEAQFQILKNVLVNVGETVGKEALPYLTTLVKELQDWAKQPEVLNSLRAMGRYVGELGKSFVNLITAMGPFVTAFIDLIPYFKVFIALKIASSFVSMATGIAQSTSALLSHANAWKQVLSGNQAAIATATATVAAAKNAATAAGAAGSAGARAASAATVPLVTRTGEAIGRVQVLNAALTQQGAVISGLATRVEQYNQKIATATSPAQKGGFTTQRNKLLTQQNAAMRVSDDLIKQQGVLGRVTGVYNTFTTANNAATGALGKASAAAGVASTYFTTMGRSIGAATGSVVTSATARLGALRGAIVAATTTAAGFSAALSALGAIAGRLLFVWLPVATVLYSIANALGLVTPVVNIFKRLIGITTESQEAIKRRESVARQALEEEESQVRAVAAGYNAIVAEITKATKAGIDFSLATKAAPVVQAENQRIAIDINYEVKNQTILADAIRDAKARLEELKAAYADAMSGSDTAEQGKLSGQVKQAQQEVANLERANNASIEESVRLRRQQGEAAGHLLTVQKAILSGYDEEGFALVKNIAEQAKYRSEVEQTRKRLVSLEEAGAKTSSNDSTRRDYAIVRGELDRLEATYRSFSETVSADMSRASIASLGFVNSLVPDLDKVDFKGLSAQIAAIELGFGRLGSVSQARMSEMAVSATSLQTKITALLAKADELQKSGDTAGANQYRGEASVLQADLAKINGMVDAYKELQSAAKTANAEMSGKVATPAEKSKKAVESLIKAYAQIGPLRQLQAATESVLRATSQIAEDMRKKYESVFKDIQARGTQTFDALAAIQVTLASRSSVLQGTAFKQGQVKEARDFEIAIKDQETAIRAKALAQGMSRTEMENEIEALHRMQDVMRRNFEAEQATAQVEQEVNAKLREKQYIQDQLVQALAKQEQLANSLKAAQAAGDNTKAAALAVELSRQADLADSHYKSLQKVVTEVAGTMANATKGLAENGTLRFRYDDESIRRVTQDIEALMPRINEVELRSRQAAADTSQAAATASSQALTSTIAEIEKVQAVIDNFSKMAAKAAPDTASQLNTMIAGLTQSAPAFREISASLQSISNADLRTGALVGGIADMRSMLTDIDRLAGGVAAKLSQEVSTDTLTALQQSLQGISAIPVKLDVSQVVPTTQNAINSSVYSVDNFNLNNLPKTVQSAINSRSYTATVYADVIPKQAKGGFAGGIPAFATGGPVRGAGTGLSDSILARLGHGEYVIDAQTVRTFGGGFFRWLQTLGQGSTGLSSLRQVLQSANIALPSLPRFAAGGMVGNGLAALAAGASSGTPSEGKMELTINVGGGSYKVAGDRDQVRGLYNAMRTLGR